MKKLGPIENTVFIRKIVNELGDFLDNEGIRYDLDVVTQVFMPDNVDETLWEPTTDIDAYLAKYSLIRSGLTDEEIQHIIRKQQEANE